MVIAIIALLVSILLPSLKRAKELAATAVCSTNVRSIGIAQHMYVGDYDGTFVPGFIDIGGSYDVHKAAQNIMEDTGLLPDKGVFLCPAEATRTINSHFDCYVGHYGTNLLASPMIKWGSGYPVRGFESSFVFHLTKIHKPSDLVLMNDVTDTNYAYEFSTSASRTNYIANVWPNYRHDANGDLLNYLFCDGHVSPSNQFPEWFAEMPSLTTNHFYQHK